MNISCIFGMFYLGIFILLFRDMIISFILIFSFLTLLFISSLVISIALLFQMMILLIKIIYVLVNRIK
jgi:hypothetical protein